MEDNDHIADVGEPGCREAEGEGGRYLKAGYLVLSLQDREASLEVGVGAVDVELQWPSANLADSVWTRQPLMFLHISTEQCILPTFICYFGDDIVGQLDCALYIMYLTLITK